MKLLWKNPGGKVVIVCLIFLTAGLLFIATDPLFGKQQLTIRIEWIDAVEECTGDGGKSIFNRRSSVPTRSGSSYCGYVMSDHGLVSLPEDGFLFPRNRKELLAKLKPDCLFDVTVSGRGADLYEGAPIRNVGIKTLRSIEASIDCNGEDTQ